jgi:hypothetical protein
MSPTFPMDSIVPTVLIVPTVPTVPIVLTDPTDPTDLWPQQFLSR